MIITLSKRNTNQELKIETTDYKVIRELKKYGNELLVEIRPRSIVFFTDGASYDAKEENYDYYNLVIATVKNSQASKIFGVGSLVNFEFEF